MNDRESYYIQTGGTHTNEKFA